MKFLRSYISAATSTPWGVAQDTTKIAPGLTWYSTAGHGGLCVSNGLAQKKLSPKARAQAIKYAGGYWYEEYVAWSIPLYENLDWLDVFNKSGFHMKKEDVERNIKQYFQSYLTGPEPTEIPPFKNLQVGDLLYIDRSDSKPFEIFEIEPNKLKIKQDGARYRFGKAAYHSRVKKVEKK